MLGLEAADIRAALANGLSAWHICPATRTTKGNSPLPLAEREGESWPPLGHTTHVASHVETTSSHLTLNIRRWLAGEAPLASLPTAKLSAVKHGTRVDARREASHR